MSQVCVGPIEKARKFRALVLQAVARVGQAPISEAIGISVATISRFLSDEDEKCMMRALQIIAAAGLKIVPADMQCFSPRKVAILMELARDHLNQMETVEQLSWED